MISIPNTKPSAPRIVSTLLILLLSAVSAFAQSFTIAPPPYLTLLDNSGNIVNNGCVWTYTAGTTTPIATYSDTMGTPNSNPIRSDSAGRFTAYLVSGVNYKFVMEQPCVPPAHGSVLRTADNISGTPSSAATTDVTGTAGEDLTAGMATYLSAGDGGKTAGLWYRADNGNAYSSTTQLVGLVPATILTGTTGTIRLAGSVANLSSLTVGTTYYVGTAGVPTSVAPAGNVRLVGAADTATSMIVAADPPPPTGAVNSGLVCGRLTLTTNVPVTVSDVTAATTLYYTPTSGCNQITLYNGTQNVTETLPQISMAVPATTATLYDVFVYDNAGTPALELLAWTSDTVRATALTLQNGFLAKAATPTRRYVGNMRTTGSSGQTEDSLLKRYVWNYYNRVPRPVQVLETTASWTYTTATWRQAHGAAGNQVECVIGWPEVLLDVTARHFADGGAGSVIVATGIGEDSTSAPATGSLGQGDIGSAALANQGGLTARLLKYPAIGRHYYAWLEWSTAGGTTTWYGQSSTLMLQTGLFGWIQG